MGGTFEIARPPDISRTTPPIDERIHSHTVNMFIKQQYVMNYNRASIINHCDEISDLTRVCYSNFSVRRLQLHLRTFVRWSRVVFGVVPCPSSASHVACPDG